VKAHPTIDKAISRRSLIGSVLAAIPALGLKSKELLQEPAAPAGSNARIKEYRRLGRTGFNVSDIGFGAGYLTNPNVLVAALDRGVNYLDAAESYGRGASDRAIGEALGNRDRKALFITTKMWLGSRQPKDKDGIKERFRKCLERMKTDYADCLMIHLCSLADVKHEPFHEAIGELKAEGRVRFSGLSNHGADFNLQSVPFDEPMDKVVLAAAEDGRFDVALFVYNYMMKDMGERILTACKAKNMGMTIMKSDPSLYTQGDQEAIKSLSDRYKSEGKETPEAVKELFKLAEERAAATRDFLKKYHLSSPEQTRQAALKFCLDNEDVHCVCPSMSTFEDIDNFIALSGHQMKAGDRALLADYRGISGDFYCRHACGICETACPQGIPVNTIMRYDYYFKAKRQEKMAMAEYANLGSCNAASCFDCGGACVKACPYGVPIQAKLILAHDTLSIP
jgi:predicted aldo/keto reductase-like oxidoreductase